MRFYLLTVSGIILVAIKGIIWEILKQGKKYRLVRQLIVGYKIKMK